MSIFSQTLMERSRFYSSLGIHNINIKETIARSLNDPVKLKKLLQTVRIPNSYRIVIYRTVFDVKSNDGEYELLKDNCAYYKPELDSSEELLVKMLLVRNWDDSPFELLHMDLPRHLVCIASSFIKIFNDLRLDEVFWIYNNFILKLDVPLYPKRNLDDFNSIFKVHALDLYEYFVIMEVDWSPSVQLWLLSYFSSVLNYEILESLWDIVVSGDTTILLYLALSCMQNLQLMGKSKEDILKMLENVGTIVNHQKVGSEAVLKWRKTL